jgi:hypothetical protein
VSDRHASRESTEARRIVAAVGCRLEFAAIVRAWFTVATGLAGVWLALLLVRRIAGLGPDWLTTETLLGLPVVALLIAFLVTCKPTEIEAARKIDTTCGASDLFLTIAQLSSSGGGYQVVVTEQAEQLAPGIRPSEIVPWKWQLPTVRLAAVAAVLVLASLFLPQLDPFGAAESANATVAVRRDLQESRRATSIRAAELSARRESAALADGTDKSLAELAAELRRLTDDRSAVSLKALDSRQRSVEARWREARNDKGVARLLENAQANQFLGQADSRSRQWAEELAKGQTDSLDEAFASLQDELETLAPSGDDVDRQERERLVRQQIAELQRFAGNQLESQFAETAMQRAMSQLDSMRIEPELKSEAAAAARESIELAQQEMHEIAQSADELASLERALSVIQSAKQLAQSGSSESAQNDESRIQEFVDQYAKLQGDMGKETSGDDQGGENEGMPNSPGQQVASTDGQSGLKDEAKSGATIQGRAADRSLNSSSGEGDGRAAGRENDRAQTAFRDARESLSLDESRRLLAMRRQGLSEAGEASEEYRKIVRSLQKRVSTAIEVEEIPPGYVSGIRRYFDSLDKTSQEGGPGKQDGPGGGPAAESDESPVADDSGEAADDSP